MDLNKDISEGDHGCQKEWIEEIRQKMLARKKAIADQELIKKQGNGNTEKST
jgi:hypothetical protein